MTRAQQRESERGRETRDCLDRKIDCVTAKILVEASPRVECCGFVPSLLLGGKRRGPWRVVVEFFEGR